MFNKIEDEIRKLANQKGQHSGDDVRNWLEAESEVLADVDFFRRFLYRAILTVRKAGVVVLNLLVIFFCGGLILTWSYYCTDWAESALALFAFGSLASYLALVGKLFPTDQLEVVRKDIVSSILKSYWPSIASVLIVLAFVAIGFFVGSVEVQAGKGGGDVRVWLYSPETDVKAVDSFPLASNGRVRFTRWTIWNGTDHRVKATGLPEMKIEVFPWLKMWGPQRLMTPSDFLRPVILVGADSNLRPPEGKFHKLQVRKKGNPSCYEADFGTRAVWIGCKEGDIDVPKEVISDWQKEMGEEAARRHLPPVGVASPERVDVDDSLTFQLVNSAGEVISKEHKLNVRRPVGVDDLVQPILLKQKDDR